MTATEKRQSVERWNRFYESNADFKQRIAIMMRERETGKRYSVVGAAPASDNVKRKAVA